MTSGSIRLTVGSQVSSSQWALSYLFRSLLLSTYNMPESSGVPLSMTGCSYYPHYMHEAQIIRLIVQGLPKEQAAELGFQFKSDSQVHALNQGLANSSPRAKSSPPSVSVINSYWNIVVLECLFLFVLLVALLRNNGRVPKSLHIDHVTCKCWNVPNWLFIKTSRLPLLFLNYHFIVFS